MENIRAKQVVFLDNVEDIHYGILCGDIVICGCCGGVFRKEQVRILNELPWISLEEEIKGDF